MIFTGLVKHCRVRAFASLVEEEEQQMTVLEFVVEPEKQEVGLIIPVPGAARIVQTYDAHLDHVGTCFDETTPEQLQQAASSFRTHMAPRVYDTFDDLLGGIYCPEKVREWLRLYYASDYSFLFLTFTEETATHPIAYVHEARADKRLFIPTRSTQGLFVDPPTDDILFDHTVFSVNTTADAGIPPMTQRFQTAFRWDMIRGVCFPEITSLHMLTHKDTHLNSDIFLATHSTPTDSRLYVGGDGSIFRDNTRLRIVQYIPHGLRTFPVINGAYLASLGSSDPFHFGGSECHFEEALYPGTDEWALRVIDEVGSETPYIAWVKPWDIRLEYGRPYLDLVEQE